MAAGIGWLAAAAAAAAEAEAEAATLQWRRRTEERLERERERGCDMAIFFRIYSKHILSLVDDLSSNFVKFFLQYTTKVDAF